VSASFSGKRSIHYQPVQYIIDPTTTMVTPHIEKPPTDTEVNSVDEAIVDGLVDEQEDSEVNDQKKGKI